MRMLFYTPHPPAFANANPADLSLKGRGAFSAELFLLPLREKVRMRGT